MDNRTVGRSMSGLAIALTALLWTSAAAAQTAEPEPLRFAILKSVLRDPATYAPSIVKFSAMTLDWETSQVFFRHGYVEHNPHFTVSGRSNDAAISHAAGSRKIVVDSVKLLALTVPENLAERTLEHFLLAHYPQHRKMLLVAGHVGRVVGS
jgi:hypothetical protein